MKKRGGRKGSGRKAPILSEAELAKATAREAASLTTSLHDESASAAGDLVDEALDEAEELGLLLDEEDPDEVAEGHEEDEYFMKAPRQGPARPRGRPAAQIVAEGAP
ncbi:MAG TPA: hypothetical protein VNL37_04380, partial [Candidatus Polarisedimenticolia bacterium]|nr:hypothetical protein [Candidatus Polarisedimenticolia bacterium]